jgi:hypothetical protein
MLLLTRSGKTPPLRQRLVAISTRRRVSRPFEWALELSGPPAKLNPNLAPLPTPKPCDSIGLSDFDEPICH